MKIMNTAAMSVAILALGMTASYAKVPESQVNRLGQDLTPVGAEKAGDGGDIPAWTGGLNSIPSNVSYQEGDHLENPFPDDKPLYVVDGSNIDKYREFLTPGQAAMLERYDDYKMKVFQTRRSCAYPQNVYAATKRNASVGTVFSVLSTDILAPVASKALHHSGGVRYMDGRGKRYHDA